MCPEVSWIGDSPSSFEWQVKFIGTWGAALKLRLLPVATETMRLTILLKPDVRSPTPALSVPPLPPRISHNQRPRAAHRVRPDSSA